MSSKHSVLQIVAATALLVSIGSAQQSGAGDSDPAERTPAPLSVSDTGGAWEIALEGVRPQSMIFLFLGLPPDDGMPVHRMSLGFFGFVDLGIASPLGPVLIGVGGADAAFVTHIPKPSPFPNEVLGLELALQCVDTVFVLSYPDVSGPAHVTGDYRPSTVATIVLAP